MIPVKDNHALYRDEKSNAIISTDMTEYKKYIDKALETINNPIEEVEEPKEE